MRCTEIGVAPSSPNCRYRHSAPAVESALSAASQRFTPAPPIWAVRSFLVSPLSEDVDEARHQTYGKNDVKYVHGVIVLHGSILVVEKLSMGAAKKKHSSKDLGHA
jgi:hypothetical protein